MSSTYNWNVKLSKLIERYEKLAKDGDKNAKKILKYNEYLILFEKNRVGFARRHTILNRLLISRKYFSKPYHECSVRDILMGINNIAETPLKNGKKKSPHSVRTDKVTLKKYLSWVAYGDQVLSKIKTEGYPEICKVIDCSFTKQDRYDIRKTDKSIFTRDEVNKMIQSSKTIRDKAIVSFLYETGCRPSEMLSVKLNQIKFTAFKGEVKVELYGKTGHRTNLIKYYSKYFIPYLNSLDIKPDDYVFKSVAGNQMSVYTLNSLIKRVATISGISEYKKSSYISGKRVSPYMFRHTSITHKLSGEFDGSHWPEQILKQYVGHTQDSTQLKTYSHLNSDDSINYIRRNTAQQEKQPLFIECNVSNCNATNKFEDITCFLCNSPLQNSKNNSMIEISEIEEMQQRVYNMAVMMAKQMTKRDPIMSYANIDREQALKIIGIGN